MTRSMLNKHTAIGLMLVVMAAGQARCPACAGQSAGPYRLAADAFRIESGWQRQASLLQAQGPSQACSETVLPEGQYAVWVRSRGEIQLTIGRQAWPVRGGEELAWHRAGQVSGGRLTLAVSAAGKAKFREVLFAARPEDAPRLSSASRADGLLLALDFAPVGQQACGDRAGNGPLRTTRRAEFTAGPWGHALRCQRGALEIEDAPGMASAVEALTTIVWARPESTTGYQALLYKGHRSGGSMAIHFHFGLCDGKPEFKFADAGGTWSGLFRGNNYPLPAVPVGSWSHLAATFDKGLIRLYLDGREVASHKGRIASLLPNDHALYVGQGQDPQGQPGFIFAGLIDDARVYGRALPAAEIASLYEAGRAAHAGTVAPQAPPEALPTPSFAQKLKIVERYEQDIPRDTIGRGPTTAAVRPHEGLPSLWINERPVAPIAMVPIDHFPRDVCRDFAAAGVHVYSHILWTWARVVPESKARKLDECTDWWLGPGQYAFERVDRQVQAIIEADPQAYIFLRLKLDPPGWWVSANPDELSQHEDGRRGPQYSMASEKWEETYERMLRDLIGHVEASSYAGHIIGYQPAGGSASEWFWYGQDKGLIDYSPAARKRFREWLRARYQEDVAALKKAWNDPEVTFATAHPPNEEARRTSEHLMFREASQARRVSDFQQFLTDITVHNIQKSCRICKEETKRRKIAGVFYGYSFHFAASGTGSFSQWNLGFLGLKGVLDCPDVDFISSPTDYRHRRGGDPGNFVSAYTDSYQLHGKLYWDEVDTRTCYYRGPDSYAVRTLPETLAVHQRAAGYGLTKGTALWWFTLTGDQTFHDEAIMEDIARIQHASQASLAVDKSHVRQIAVLADEQSFLYMRMGVGALMQPLMREMHDHLATMGAPFDMYLLSDIANASLPDYKLYVVLNPFYLTDATRAAIKAKVRRNNAVAAWFYAPGFVAQDGTLNAQGIGDLTGIAVRESLEERPLHLAITDFDHPITAKLRRSNLLPQTGPVGPVFWVDDPQARTLGRLVPDGKTGLAVREFDTWRSVYSAVPTMSTSLLRGLARYAGAHVYSTSDDVFYANHHYAMIHTATAGAKQIDLPQARDVFDALSGDVIARNTAVIRLEMPEQTTRIFRLTSPTNP